MARRKISEFKTKRLILNNNYKGLSLTSKDYSDEISELDKFKSYVVKVDQGIKKRMKQGLMKVNLTVKEAEKFIKTLVEQGYQQFLIEEVIEHFDNEEKYLSIERVREGLKVLFSDNGGINVEDNSRVSEYLLTDNTSIKNFVNENNLNEEFIKTVLNAFNDHLMGFLEINPLVCRKSGENLMLDAACLVDSSAEFLLPEGSWTSKDFIVEKEKTVTEKSISKLDSQTPASLKFNVLNPDGSLFFLLSSGGASIIIVDEAYEKGYANEIANYGEYSGGPTRLETYLYSKEVLKFMISSKSKKKALIIAGGVSNFTDVLKTFSGIVDALDELKADLVKQGIKIFVRRGGPNEEKGLKVMEDFLKENNLLGSVYGSKEIMTAAVNDAIKFLDKRK